MPYVFSFSLFLNIVNTTARRIKGQGKASARTRPTLSSSLGFSVQTLTHPGGGGGLEDQGTSELLLLVTLLLNFLKLLRRDLLKRVVRQ